MGRFRAVVAGASGVVGRRLAEHLITRDWDVIGLSRRLPDGASFPTLSVDLTDAADCLQKLAGVSDVTHILYAGRYTHDGSPEPIEINTAMLANLVDVVEPRNKGLQHIHMV